MWFEGYWWWVCPSGAPTSPQKFALWNVTGQGRGTVLPGSVVTSGPLTAGQWNWVPLPVPLPLAIGTCYNACTGFTGSFPDTNNQFDSGGPYAAGLTSGPLSAYSDLSGSLPSPYTMSQGLFGTAGDDPSVNMPGQGSNSANFWIDLQVTDTAPAGYSGTYRLWPGKYDAAPQTNADSAVNYVVATEVHFSQPCAINNIWYYTPGGAGQLATECGIWDISTSTLVAGNTSPAWSGAAGSGWVACPFTGVILPAGRYKVAVYNGAATPDPWNAKQLNYWDVGAGQNGITNGPLYAPQLAAATTADIYEGSGQEPGQSTFAIGPPNQYPDLYVNGLAQNYWVDVEVTPTATAPSSPPPSSPPPSTPPPSSPPASSPPPAKSRGFLGFFP
jgi:hypothetical protein